MRTTGPARGLLRAGVAFAISLGLCGAASPALASGLRVREAGGVTFPDRTLIVSVPQKSNVSAGRVHITEDGHPVSGVSVTPLSQSGAVGVVVAIDSDPSMGGTPLAQAMLSARGLASHRTGNEQLGVVYGDGTSIPLSSDPFIIQQALEHTPKIGHAINLLEATRSAIDELRAARVTDGAVIFVTDDIDRDAHYTPEAIAAYARAAHVRIFVVGIRDAAYYHPNSQDLPPDSMQTLATSTGGSFVATNPGELAGVFTRIGAGIISDYVVGYRSAEKSGRTVALTVTVDGVGIYRGRYLTPALAVATTLHHRARQPFWNSPNMLTLAAIVCAVLLGLAFATLLNQASRAEPLQSRMSAYGTDAEPETEILPEPGPRKVGALLSRRRWWPAFEENVDVGRMSRSARELAYISVAGSILTFVLLKLVVGVVIFPIGATALAPFVIRALVNRAATKQRNLFMDQFPGLIHEVAGAMRIGRSLVEALGSVMGTADEPSRREFDQALADERAGRHIEDALRTIGDRMQCEEIEQVAVVAALHRRTGANITEVLDRVADTARQRAEIRRELQTLTAQARMSRNVLVALPPFVVTALTLIAGAFEKPLYNTGPGRMVLVFSTFMIATGAKVMKSIVNIEE